MVVCSGALVVRGMPSISDKFPIHAVVQDFYLDLTEDGQRITARDYLESALEPAPGTGKAIIAKNQVCSASCPPFPSLSCLHSSV
jgi:hypothetical protein